MLEISFTVKDVARTRLAISPLWEVVASAKVLKAARPDPLYRRWAETVRPRLTGAGPGVRLLFDLIQPCWYLPDFLSPPPLTPVPDLTAELTGLRDLPADQIRADLDVLAHALTHPVSSLEQVTRPRRRSAGPMRSAPSARVASLYDDPPDGLGLLASGIETYWRIAIEPWWGRIRATLDGDLVHRGRQLANGGHALLLDDLSPRVRWHDGVLRIRHLRFSGHRRLHGEGLLLVPSAFAGQHVTSNTIPPWQPSLVYPARGLGAIWQPERVDPPEAVSRVIGRSRTTLITHLESPRSTTDLAARTGLTPGGVSQHLGALHDAGLVSAHRARRSVLYARTELAEALLGGGR
ncbi:MAG TPA: DUF5937 family protein [Kribbellaceae bacterium]